LGSNCWRPNSKRRRAPAGAQGKLGRELPTGPRRRGIRGLVHGLIAELGLRWPAGLTWSRPYRAGSAPGLHAPICWESRGVVRPRGARRKAGTCCAVCGHHGGACESAAACVGHGSSLDLQGERAGTKGKAGGQASGLLRKAKSRLLSDRARGRGVRARGRDREWPATAVVCWGLRGGVRRHGHALLGVGARARASAWPRARRSWTARPRQVCVCVPAVWEACRRERAPGIVVIG
jgi:hypothetical protein